MKDGRASFVERLVIRQRELASIRGCRQYAHLMLGESLAHTDWFGRAPRQLFEPSR
jgi:hypothetical protein